jgi:hypothetical protein
MIQHLSLENILCLDIETVPQYSDYSEVPEEMRKLWLRKAGNLKKEEHDDEVSIYPRAGIYAEFGKIICISTGFLSLKDGKRSFRLKSFFGDDEHALLSEFGLLLQQIHDTRLQSGKALMLLCGHNAREFDFPYISRRMIINGISLPPQLDLFGKKPWEITHLDTMELWKFGDFKSYTPLNLLAHILGIPSPKDDIDGSQVGQVYWQERNLDRIVTYCQKDVVTVMQILLRFKGDPVLMQEEVFVI